jgi:hypothetical protein
MIDINSSSGIEALPTAHIIDTNHYFSMERKKIRMQEYYTLKYSDEVRKNLIRSRIRRLLDQL